jgi:hypothetical protein
MATMNKPASDSTNWYQNVTDNWTTVENDLLEKRALLSKGDLLAATGSAAPSRVGVGTNLDFLLADSTQSSGVRWTDPTVFGDQDLIDLLWGKKFFSDESFLPSTKIFEYIGTPPAFAGTAGSASWTRDPGCVRPSTSGIGWYDLGAAKSKILIVVGNLLKLSNDIAVILSSSAPSGLDPDGYGMWNNTNGPSIRKRSGGVYTRLDTGTGFSNTDYRCGYALYYDDSTDTLKVFLRTGSQWFLAQSATDSTFTTMRYVSFQAAAANQRWVTPYVCYAQ